MRIATQIHQRYLAPGAKLEILLPDAITETDRIQIRAKINAGRAPQNLFHNAQRNVMQYFKEECFQEFMHSKEGKRLKRTLRHSEHLYGTLVDSGIL